MATTSGLIRSFYGFLVRRERALKEAGNDVYAQLLPAQRPTSLSAVTRIAFHAVRVLKSTEFEERAVYWAELFEKIRAEGWKGDLRLADISRQKIQAELKESLRVRNLAFPGIS